MNAKNVYVSVLSFLTICCVLRPELFLKQEQSFPMNFKFVGGDDSYIHFSVNDTVMIFYNLTKNENVYKSIFENDILNSYKNLHKKCNAVFSFYCFYDFSGICLKQATGKFANQFSANSDWLELDDILYTPTDI